MTRGVVIGRLQSGEGSVRAQIYAEEFGLIHALAKSAREERSQLRAHLTIGTYGVFTLVKGECEWRVVGATDTTNAHFAIAATSTHVPAATQEASARIIAVVRQLVHGEGSNHQLFNALWEFLSTLHTSPHEDIIMRERHTVLAVLAALGYVAAPDTIAERDVVRHINKGLMASGLVS